MDYCRELETYLCQKNEGHLIRIVGPAFDLVCGWAAQGVPIAVAKKGIDQYCARYYAKGPRRRAVRIEFCEPDVLELFDAWRRAVGVTAVDEEHAADALPSSRRDTLPAHVDRVISRLTALRAGGKRSRPFDDAIADAVRELDLMRGAAKQARGAERTALLERLSAIDVTLLQAAARELDEPAAAELRREADAEVAPFAARMTADARASAAAGAFDRRLRGRIGVPVVAFE